MPRGLIIGGALALAACASTPGGNHATDVRLAELEIALSAICGADRIAGRTFKPDLQLSPHLGTVGGFKVDSKVAAAQTWFDYGLALSNAFYHEDAKIAMRKAAAADVTCARCAWGEAWVLGPTLNYRIAEGERAEALSAAERARGLVKEDDRLARRLSDALVARYTRAAESTEPRFGSEMAQISSSYPDEVEVAVVVSEVAAFVVVVVVAAGWVTTIGVVAEFCRP